MLLTKIKSAKNETAFNHHYIYHHRVLGLYFLTVIFAAAIVLPLITKKRVTLVLVESRKLCILKS